MDQFRELWRTKGTKASIDSQRAWTRRGTFFLNGLHEAALSVNRQDDLVDIRNDDEKEEEKSPAYVKRKVLHIMATECRLNRALHGSHAMIQSELEWFGSSLPHWAVLIVLAFFGVPQKWLSSGHAHDMVDLAFLLPSSTTIIGSPFSSPQSTKFRPTVPLPSFEGCGHNNQCLGYPAAPTSPLSRGMWARNIARRRDLGGDLGGREIPGGTQEMGGPTSAFRNEPR
jgi:hypothetical protein